MIFTHQARMRCFARRIMQPSLSSSLDSVINNRISTSESVGTDDFASAQGSLRDDSFASLETDYGDIDVDPDTGERLAMYRNDQQMSYGGAPTVEDMLLPLSKQTKQTKINRFKNGSVLEVTITQSSIVMRLLLEGEIDEPKPKYVYYVLPGSENKDAGALNGQYQVTPFVPVKIQNTIYQDVGNKTYVFYLMRHGQATHNLVGTKFQKFSKIFSGERDTHLTDAGRDVGESLVMEWCLRHGGGLVGRRIARGSGGTSWQNPGRSSGRNACDCHLQQITSGRSGVVGAHSRISFKSLSKLGFNKLVQQEGLFRKIPD